MVIIGAVQADGVGRGCGDKSTDEKSLELHGDWFENEIKSLRMVCIELVGQFWIVEHSIEGVSTLLYTQPEHCSS